MGKNKGVNSKVEAANQKKAAAQEVKNAKKRAEGEKKLSKEWSVGADNRGASRREQDEAKRQQQDQKAAEKKRLAALENEALSSVKTVRSATRRTKAQKEMDKPWELALESGKKKGGSSRRQMEMAAKKKEEEDIEEQLTKPQAFDGLATLNIDKNRNREAGVEEARNIDDAIGMLSVGGGKDERNPERRAKAAYKAFEEATLPQLKEDYPRLKLSQYKQKLSELWRKSPENPLNQVHTAYNAKK